jgi:hypothetical protein
MPILSTSHEPSTSGLKEMRPEATVSVGASAGLRETVASQSGCITFLDVLQACYEVAPDTVEVSMRLGGNAIGRCTLTSADPTCRFRGGLFALLAEVTASFDFADIC